MRAFDVWRAHLALWLPPLVLLLLGILGFAFYQYAFAGQVEALRAGFEGEERELAALRAEVAEAESLLDQVAANENGIEHLYDERFATEAERFTRMITEVKALARQAGLAPTSFSYPDQTVEELDLVVRQVTFQVEGTYEQLRTFINLLELTDQFLILEQIGLSAGGDRRAGGRNTLSISLGLRTVFRQPARATDAGRTSS